MYPLVEPRQRPERFLLNRFSPLAENAALLGLGGFDAAGSVWYPDARRLLGVVPNDGTLTGMDPGTDWVWVPELGRWATNHLASSSKRIEVSYTTTFTSGSFSCWFRPEGGYTGTTDEMLCRMENGAGTNLIQFYLNDDGRLYIYSYDGSTVTQSASTTSSWADQWYHGVGTWGAGGTEVWVNGVRHDADAGARTVSIIKFAIGARPGGAIGLNGWIADPCVFARAISGAAISALADPSNVMLKVGNVPLILPPRRVAFPAAVAETPSGFKPYWARRSSQIIGGGIA